MRLVRLARVCGLVLMLPLLLSACEVFEVEPEYDWRPYNRSVGLVAAWDDSFDVPAQIRDLKKHIGKTKKDKLELPPGVRVHLAYLYLLDGDQPTAFELLDEEVAKFPESKHFVNSLRARLKQAKRASQSQ